MTVINRIKNIRPGLFREHLHFIPRELKLRLKIHKHVTALLLLAIAAACFALCFVDYSPDDIFDIIILLIAGSWCFIAGSRMIYNNSFKRDGYKNDSEL
jgi:hypothetical protein